MSGRQLTINDHRIYVEIHGPGDGLPVVLLHHGLGASRSWRKQVPNLTEAGYRVIAYDRWGFGKSDPRQRYNIPGFGEDVADLKALLEELGLDRAALVGHSDGGKVAVRYAAVFPQRVAALVLIATHAFIEPKMETGILAIRQQYEQEPGFRKRLARLHGEKSETVFWGWFNGWINPQNAGWDLRPLLREIACPALVIQGLLDEHATPDQARQIAAAIPHAELWLAPGAGHLLQQERPEVLNRRLIDFLERSYHLNLKYTSQEVDELIQADHDRRADRWAT